MLIIYHSRGAVRAHQAAAIHTNRIPQSWTGAPNLSTLWEALGGPGLLKWEGLCDYGTDELGRRIFALGQASRPDIVHRAFHGMAEVFGVTKARFLLQHVGSPIAWDDMWTNLAARVALNEVGRHIQLRALHRGWPVAAVAVSEARHRAQLREEERP